jgi:hypothetical protein
VKADKLNSWLTLGANIGVVIGLFLVAYQIRQDADLTNAQLFSESTDSRREWNQAMMGSDQADPYRYSALDARALQGSRADVPLLRMLKRNRKAAVIGAVGSRLVLVEGIYPTEIAK